MEPKTLGKMIAFLRKQNKMTQNDLAELMGVTDKAVSKWERDLSCPDITALPRLAEIFRVGVDELLQCSLPGKRSVRHRAVPTVLLILRAIPIAMGVAVFVLSLMDALDAASGMGMLALGLVCLAVASFQKTET